jgi:aldehyde dehydrogenase (NAD+)
MATTTFESLNPSTGEVIETFPRSTASDVEHAVATAREAWEDWRLVPAPERGNILFRFAQLLEQRKPELSDLMTREMGKVKAEAGGDVQEAIDMSYYMGGEGRRLFGQTTPSELRDKFMMSVRMPVGVVGAITPWNFPIAIPAWKLCPALVCGNTVVLKPAEDTPLLAQRFVDLLYEAGLPEGVVQVVHGFGEEAGDALVRHPDVPVVTFTGSRETGVLVTKNAADQLKHVHLELGGKNGIIVMEDADVDLAVEGILWSAFGTAGQRCTAASRVIVHRAVYEELQKKLVAGAEKMRIGAPWEDDTQIGPVINETAVEKIHSYTEIGKGEGAKLLTGGERDGAIVSPAVVAGVDPRSPLSQEELFGPAVAVSSAEDFQDAIAQANGTPYGLGAGIFTSDVSGAVRAIREIDAGTVHINWTPLWRADLMPYGGLKASGIGKEGPRSAVAEMTDVKTVVLHGRPW